ncbi:hypothetical protein WR25_11833 [Diploscapter pachys]|uniref:peptide-O-fucosyltransferase n=1 Tax=Diploscapter pachys TaxID=2018661 RepID=A0A2A2KLQ7_9BILA|nr:hypothetical protein WR25_11833 [Diploscapter pachys]
MPLGQLFPSPSSIKEKQPSLKDDSAVSFVNYVNGWNGKHIAKWIEGLGDSMNPYLVLVRDHIRNGKQLCTVDMEYLLSIGICALGPRKMIQQAIELLLYFCYEAPTENLQTLAMKVRIACNNVIAQFGLSMKLKEKKCTELRELCEQLIRSDDPLVICTNYMQRAALRRYDENINWGLNLQSSYRGVHVISEIKVGSPADLCGRIDAGDEIMIINGKTVIGWDLSRVVNRIAAADKELQLVVNKRPRDALPKVNNKVSTPKQPTRPLVKIAPGNQATNTTEDKGINPMAPFIGKADFPVERRRSTSAISEYYVIAEIKEKAKLTRRASIQAKRSTRRRIGKDLHSHIESDLLELIRPAITAEEEERVVRRVRTMRHQPDGYVRSFIDNRLVQDVDEDCINEHIPISMKCPTEFAQIVVVEPDELQALNVSSPNIADSEWTAPINEHARSRIQLDAAASIERPSAIPSRITSSMEDSLYGMLPSPSASSVHSGSTTPAGTGNTHLPLDYHSDDAPSTPLTPGGRYATEKIFEGWLRRRKTNSELSAHEVTNKWPKCWMSLRGPFLYIYANQFSKKPEFTINIARCNVLESTDLKTSKKFVFRISRPPIEYHFSCYNCGDMKNWMQKIAFASAVYGGQTRSTSQSVSQVAAHRLSDSSDDPLHYNTLTGMPGKTGDHPHDSPKSIPTTVVHSPSYSSSTLPRPNLLPSLNIGAAKQIHGRIMNYGTICLGLLLIFSALADHETVSEVNGSKYSLAKEKRYLIYDTNHGEGFNLRRDVYMRIANTVRFLRESGENFILVLPPWGPMVHWREELMRLKWAEFFDTSSLNHFVPVMEFDDFIKEAFRSEDYPHSMIDVIIYLQHYKEGWGTEYKLKHDKRECLNNAEKLFKKDEDDGLWRSWFFSYYQVRAKHFECISIQGDAKSLAEMILSEYENEEKELDSTDEKDDTVLPENWWEEKPKRSSKGGNYLCAHWRRRDFVRAHDKDVPSIEETAKQLNSIAKRENLEKIFIATDSEPEDIAELEKLLKYPLVRYKNDKDFNEGQAAIVEQWICAHAGYFIGTHHSTFSFRIQEDREIIGFPENKTFNRLCPYADKSCERPSLWKIEY